jgi:hypothetical protein
MEVIPPCVVGLTLTGLGVLDLAMLVTQSPELLRVGLKPRICLRSHNSDIRGLTKLI